MADQAYGLSDERIALLEAIEFQWDARMAKWMAKYNELASHVAINGLGTIPSLRANKTLRWWVETQQREYRKKMQGGHSTLTDKRKELLDKLGFPW